LIESGALSADPGKAIEGTAYSDVNALYVIPGPAIYTANQQGETVPFGQPEKDVVAGRLLLSLRTADNDQRVLAEHLNNGGTLLVSKSLTSTFALVRRLAIVSLIIGAIAVAIAGVASATVGRSGLRLHRSRRAQRHRSQIGD
jgi:two-component system sensor histidine kinase MprB